MKLRSKVFCMLISVAITPLLLITVIAYTRFTKTTNDSMDEISHNNFNNAVSDLSDTIQTIKQTAGLFTFYSDGDFSIVGNLLEFADPNEKHESYDVWKANQNIKFVCQNVLFSYNYIYGLYVFTPSGEILWHKSNQAGDIHARYHPEEDDWYQNTIALEGALYISSVAKHSMFSGTKETVFFAQSLYDVYSHEFLGVLIINCDPSLFDISNNNSLPELTLFELSDHKSGNILYSNKDTVTSQFPTKNCKIYEKSLELAPLTLTAYVDYDSLFQEFNFTGILLIVSMVIFALTVILVSRYFSRSLTQPIEHLSRKMSDQDGKHLTSSSCYLTRTDEIGTLYNEYNSMIEELNTSIKKNYQDKLITLDAQMKSLEARINSHFLFNTLESINSIAEIEDSERIATISLALGNMFRYSIKTKSELVTIAEELNHVNDYVSIQRIRFSNKFSLRVQLPDAMYSYKVLKLILQPLVENALYHGLGYCACGDLIQIVGHTDQSYIYLNVIDNGQGMSAEKLEKLKACLREEASFTELGHRGKQSIGLTNIHTRIELYYGRGYGLSIDSKEGEGTNVEIKLPILGKGEL